MGAQLTCPKPSIERADRKGSVCDARNELPVPWFPSCAAVLLRGRPGIVRRSPGSQAPRRCPWFAIHRQNEPRMWCTSAFGKSILTQIANRVCRSNRLSGDGLRWAVGHRPHDCCFSEKATIVFSMRRLPIVLIPANPFNRVTLTVDD